MDNYYVIRNKETGFYFRGKGANRWGKYFNQASIYRLRANAENTARWLNLRGEPVEIVPIQIIENAIGMVKAVPCKNCKHYDGENGYCECMGFTCHTDDYCSYGERKHND